MRILVLILLLATPASAAHYTVFLLGGQSNMVGVGDGSELTAPFNSPLPAVQLWYGHSEGSAPKNQWIDLRSGSGLNFGPELAFGHTLAGELFGENVALVKYAKSGTSLYSDWDASSGPQYASFRSTVSAALNAFTNAGDTYEIAAMLWTQGERDARAERSQTQYAADLTEFIADVRSRYGSELPFLLSLLSPAQTNLGSLVDPIIAAQEQVALADPWTTAIDTSDLTLNDDDLHFDAAGQLALGERFAAAYLETLSGDYNGDGDVNGADLLAWQREGGSLAMWRQQYGQSGVQALAVPEASSLLLSFAGLLCWCARHRAGTVDRGPAGC